MNIIPIYKAVESAVTPLSLRLMPICRHPAELEADAVLSREYAYPDHFTSAERIAERMNRVRSGLVHVMTEICPTLEAEQAEAVYCWLDKVLDLVEMVRIDTEGKA